MESLYDIIWSRFGASIDALKSALVACPEEGFAPPAPFGLEELDPIGLMPDRVYGKAELHTYLRYCRQKCQATIQSLIEESAHRTHTFGWGTVSFAELRLYNLRHVQHHTAQLNMILRQKVDSAPHWVARAKG